MSEEPYCNFMYFPREDKPSKEIYSLNEAEEYCEEECEKCEELISSARHKGLTKVLMTDHHIVGFC